MRHERQQSRAADVMTDLSTTVYGFADVADGATYQRRIS